MVRIRISDEDGTGYIEEVQERKNRLKRPAVANVDQAMIVVSIVDPDINLNLLDRYLVQVEHQNLESVICFNKSDLIPDALLAEYRSLYERIGYKVIGTSALSKQGIEPVLEALEGKVTAILGPSGVGKSTLLNALNPEFQLETGGISQKTRRGKHTTRHVELFPVGTNGFAFDTPGFSSLEVTFIEEGRSLSDHFPEMKVLRPDCRFDDCVHENEPDCAVKKALNQGQIARSRYDNYLLMLEEIRSFRRY